MIKNILLAFLGYQYALSKGWIGGPKPVAGYGADFSEFGSDFEGYSMDQEHKALKAFPLHLSEIDPANERVLMKNKAELAKVLAKVNEAEKALKSAQLKRQALPRIPGKSNANAQRANAQKKQHEAFTQALAAKKARSERLAVQDFIGKHKGQMG